MSRDRGILSGERSGVKVKVHLPKAFSVREEHEFYPVQHLTARLNPRLRVVQVATGMHVHGGCNVLWGIVYHESTLPTRKEVEAALREAGFDFTHSNPF